MTLPAFPLLPSMMPLLLCVVHIGIVSALGSMFLQIHVTSPVEALLVLGRFGDHLLDCVLSWLATTCTDVAVTPGGLMSVPQPLYVCVNRMFSADICHCYS